MTYTEDDLTSWFPPDVKPRRKGIYQTNTYPDSKLVPVFQYWNGREWGFFSIIFERAYERRFTRSVRQASQWRGLNKRPRKKQP